MTLIGKKKLDKQFYHTETIKNEVITLTLDYFKNQMILSGHNGTEEALQAMAIEIVEETYKNPIENIRRLPESTRLMLN
jgi:ERCC4-type nuclease